MECWGLVCGVCSVVDIAESISVEDGPSDSDKDACEDACWQRVDERVVGECGEVYAISDVGCRLRLGEDVADCSDGGGYEDEDEGEWCPKFCVFEGLCESVWDG